jgi:N-ethylmaleimide reductase
MALVPSAGRAVRRGRPPATTRLAEAAFFEAHRLRAWCWVFFDGYRLGDLALPNRVVMAPMTRVRAAAGGLATPSMATYYAQRATAGLIVSEGVQPSLIGQSNPGTPGLHTDEQVAAWRPVTAAVHANGGRIFAQIMHGGRVSHPDTIGTQPIGPSAVPAVGDVFTPSGLQPAPMPRALDTAEVPEHAQSYADAARRAIDAGFDGVELHGANGYLISQFLSSNANLRTDRYGGSVANRIRFAVEAAAAHGLMPTRGGVEADRRAIPVRAPDVQEVVHVSKYSWSHDVLRALRAPTL